MNLKKLLIGVALTASVVTLTGFEESATAPQGYKLISEVYTVRHGDTLWSISGRFMEKNNYAKRDIREFQQGIVELNYDDVFKGREPGLIMPGDELKINYWVKGK